MTSGAVKLAKPVDDARPLGNAGEQQRGPEAALVSPLPATAPRRLRLCLAASGGGHVRQILDLEPAWASHDYFFVTEDSPLSRSIAARHRTHFVEHVALGQARLGSPLRMLAAGVRNFLQSARIMVRERPQVLISTGAGAAFFPVVWARLLGARIVIIETFARFEKPSVFAKIAAPLADRMVVQSAALSSYWPHAAVFDPLRLLSEPPPSKRPFLFVTVGAILTFDRLIDMVAQLKVRGDIPEEVFMQIGVGGHPPAGIDSAETLPYDRMQSLLSEADIVVCHGGTGSIITALRQGCRVIAVPRMFEHGEVYDDHQEAITGALAARGLLTVARTVDELAAALKTVRARPSVSATSDPAELIDHLNTLFSRWTPKPRRAERAVRP